MKIKEVLITIVITLGVCCLFGINYYANRYILNAAKVYRVYLDGNIIGYIQDDDELYNLINKKQESTKKKYNVSEVYPPNDFEIIESSSYNVELSTAEQIYEEMSKTEPFTIKGYVVSITGEDDDKKHINILDKDIFDNSVQTFIKAFISEKEYDDYMNGTQEEIETTGKIIDLMYFDEEITIKKSYINVDEKIYTDETELSQYLLFGDDSEIQKYEVKTGDTIESISESNKLNPIEFLIANPQYKSEDSLLKIGDTVNITLINPQITLAYDVTEVADIEIPYEKKTEVDSSKSSGYSEVTTEGVKGLTRTTENYVVKNGETQGGVVILGQEVLVEKVDQVTTVGPSYSWSDVVTGTYIDTGETWQWPTNYPYMITSGFGYRWGAFHDGIDISGTGYNSPIYAALDGTVISATWEGMCGSGCGYNIVIQHANGYTTVYAHMVQGSFKVSVGDHVTRGQVIGGMGSTGNSTGTHLHFGVWDGIPYKSNRINPLSLW